MQIRSGAYKRLTFQVASRKNKSCKGHPKVKRGVKYRNLAIIIIANAKLGGVQWCMT